MCASKIKQMPTINDLINAATPTTLIYSALTLPRLWVLSNMLRKLNECPLSSDQQFHTHLRHPFALMLQITLLLSAREPCSCVLN